MTWNKDRLLKKVGEKTASINKHNQKIEQPQPYANTHYHKTLKHSLPGSVLQENKMK